MGDFTKDLEEAKAILYDHAAGNPELYVAIEIIERALERGDGSVPLPEYGNTGEKK